MALSDRSILEYKKKGLIVIDPFVTENLATSSYDVTLGEWFFREEHPHKLKNVYNPYSKKETDMVWGTTPHRAEKAKDVLLHCEFDRTGIDDADRVIILDPGETILAHTNEFIGGRGEVTTMMKARSSTGRNFIEVCKCAGWGDVGYVNRWTMEITNNSRHYAIPLVVGRRIAQLVFFHVGPILDTDYTKTGKYQSSQNLTELKKSWKPDMMLPRLWNDRDIKKGKKS